MPLGPLGDLGGFHAQALGKVTDHAAETLAQWNLGLPPQRLLGLHSKNI